MPNYYPLMLDIRGRKAIVIGGDAIAAEKAAALAACGAFVTVMHVDFCAELLAQAEQKAITLQHKTYVPGDLAGAFVVVAAVKDQHIIDLIWQETQEHGQLVNIVDVPAYCNFILPSILRRGQLTIAVSTEGASPALAKRVRIQLEEHFPPAYAPYLKLAAVVRTQLRLHNVSYARRDDFFAEFFTSDILRQLIAGNEAAALEITTQLLQQYVGDSVSTAVGPELKEAIHP